MKYHKTFLIPPPLNLPLLLLEPLSINLCDMCQYYAVVRTWNYLRMRSLPGSEVVWRSQAIYSLPEIVG